MKNPLSSYYKANPNKKEYIRQVQFSLDRLWSRGLIGLEEYQPTVKALKKALARAEKDTDGI